MAGPNAELCLDCISYNYCRKAAAESVIGEARGAIAQAPFGRTKASARDLTNHSEANIESAQRVLNTLTNCTR